MPWLAVPFNAQETKLKLTKRYSVDSVPTLILLDSNGAVITKKGREKIYRDPKGLLFPWYQCHLEDELGHQFFKSATNVLSEDIVSPSKTITTVNIKDLFAKNRYVMLYFCAKWCAPCKAFTQVLTKYCRSLRERLGSNYDLQVIICSMDVEEEEFQDYFLDMLPSWLAIPYYDKWRVEALSERLNVENIPHVVVISSDGVVINLSARRRIEMDPTAIGYPHSLRSPLIENLGLTTRSYGFDLNRKPSLVLLMEGATHKQQMAVIKLIEPFAVALAESKVNNFWNFTLSLEEYMRRWTLIKCQYFSLPCAFLTGFYT